MGLDVATIDGVMGVIEILSSRREYTKLNPFVVLLGNGDHEVTSSWTGPNGYERPTTLVITRNNISFVGNGVDTTTVLGEFGIFNIENIRSIQYITVQRNDCDKYKWLWLWYTYEECKS